MKKWLNISAKIHDAHDWKDIKTMYSFGQTGIPTTTVKSGSFSSGWY